MTIALKDGDKIKCVKGHTVCQIVNVKMLSVSNRWSEALGKWRHGEPKIGAGPHPKCGMCGADINWPKLAEAEPKPVTLSYPTQAPTIQPGSCPLASQATSKYSGIDQGWWNFFELPMHAKIPEPDHVVAAVVPDYRFYDDAGAFAAFAFYRDNNGVPRMSALLIGAWKGLYGTRQRLADAVKRDCKRLRVGTLLIEYGPTALEFASLCESPWGGSWNTEVTSQISKAPLPIQDKVDAVVPLFAGGRVFVPVTRTPQALNPRSWAVHATHSCAKPNPYGLQGNAVLSALCWVRVQQIKDQLRARSAGSN